MIKPLDPYHLTPAASLNRLQIVDLPGFSIEPEVYGKTGYELVSSSALCQLIRQQADSLKLSPVDAAKDERELPIVFDQCFESGESDVRTAAQAIAQQFARRLAAVLLTLKRGDAVNRAARADWDNSYWDYWGAIESVCLGGGLMSGHLGKHAAPTIREILKPYQNIALDHYGTILPMIGAARYTSPGYNAALVLDFGGSFVKRTCAHYEGDTLNKLGLMPSIRTQFMQEGESRQLLDFTITTIADSWRRMLEAGITPAPVILVSMAAYIRDGQPLERQGGAYANLRTVSDNVRQTLSAVLSSRLDTPVNVLLLHDGTSAAATYGGQRHSAVIMLGTALGVGFPPHLSNLRPRAQQIVLEKFKET